MILKLITFEVLLEAAKFDVISNNCNLSCFFYITTQMLRKQFKGQIEFRRAIKSFGPVPCC